jgi:hypothetical protein
VYKPRDQSHRAARPKSDVRDPPIPFGDDTTAQDVNSYQAQPRFRITLLKEGVGQLESKLSKCDEEELLPHSLVHHGTRLRALKRGLRPACTVSGAHAVVVAEPTDTEEEANLSRDAHEAASDGAQMLSQRT